jgi:hypothetical protein
MLVERRGVDVLLDGQEVLLGPLQRDCRVFLAQRRVHCRVVEVFQLAGSFGVGPGDVGLSGLLPVQRIPVGVGCLLRGVLGVGHGALRGGHAARGGLHAVLGLGNRVRTGGDAVLGLPDSLGVGDLGSRRVAATAPTATTAGLRGKGSLERATDPGHADLECGHGARRRAERAR